MLGGLDGHEPTCTISWRRVRKYSAFAHTRAKNHEPAAVFWKPWWNRMRLLKSCRDNAPLRGPELQVARPRRCRSCFPSIAPVTPSSAHTSATARCFSSPNLRQPLLLSPSPLPTRLRSRQSPNSHTIALLFRDCTICLSD